MLTIRVRPRKTSPELNLRQRGITLLESLVAIVILAIGILALLGIQLRTLTDTQTGVRRAQAVRAIEDLAERIKTNPDGFAQLRAGTFTSDWNAPATVALDYCDVNPCNSLQLAQWDLAGWRSTIAQTLPLGQAKVFLSPDENADPANRRQLGVMVGWRASERSHAATDTYVAPFNVSAAGFDCPAGLICHLMYVQP